MSTSCTNKNSSVEPDSVSQIDEKSENYNLDSANGECVNSADVSSSLIEPEKNTLVIKKGEWVGWFYKI